MLDFYDKEKEELLMDLEHYKFCTRMYKTEAAQLRAELEDYKKEIMLLRNGYDEEDCTRTCPNLQLLERENKELLETIDRLVSAQTRQS